MVLAVVVHPQFHGFAAQDGRIADAPLVIGNVSIPAGAFVWHTPSNAIEKRTGVVVNTSVSVAGINAPAGSVLIFGPTDRIEVLHTPGPGAQPPTCTFLDANGRALERPGYPRGAVSRERATFTDAPMPNGPILQLAREVRDKTRTETSLSVVSDVSHRAVLGAAWQLSRAGLRPGTYAEWSVDGSAVFLASLEPVIVGGVNLPAGTCLTVTTNDVVGGVVTASPKEIPYRGAMVASGSPVLWGDDVTPGSYLIAQPLAVRRGTLPANSFLWQMNPATLVVRPPVLTKIDTVPIDASAFTRLRNNWLEETYLAEDWTYKDQERLPAQSHVYFERGRLTMADLPVTTVIRGLSITGVTLFHPDRGLAASHLTMPADVDGYSCEAAAISFAPNGHVTGCSLQSPQTVAGVKLRAGPFEISETGALLRGTLDQDLRIGSSQFRAGQFLNGVIDDRAVITLLEADGLEDLKNRVDREMSTALPEALVAMKSQAKGLFGSFGPADIAQRPASTRVEARAIVSDRTYEIRNFLTNPPFADCDARVSLTAELAWSAQDGKVAAFTRLRPGSLFTIDTNICPTTSLVLWFGRMLNPLFSLSDERRDLAANVFTDLVLARMSPLLEQSVAPSHVYRFSVRPEDLYVEGGRLRGAFSFERELR